MRRLTLNEFYQQLRSQYSDLLENSKLHRLEVLVLGLYTGPLYILYNAVMRGFPAHLVDLLNTDSAKDAELAAEDSKRCAVHGNR